MMKSRQEICGTESIKYLRNRIKEYKKYDLLSRIFKSLIYSDSNDIMLCAYLYLLKLTNIYGETSQKIKPLTDQKYSRMINVLSYHTPYVIKNFINNKKWDKSLRSLYTQQMYYQMKVDNNTFNRQLLLYKKYDSFFEKNTGISITEFIICSKQTFEFISRSKSLFIEDFKHENQHPKYHLFVKQLCLKNINDIKNKISYDIQPLLQSPFTMLPIHKDTNNKLRILNLSIFKYTTTNYIYDYLKLNLKNFSSLFGDCFENYVELGLKEINANYINENMIEKILPNESNLVDFKINNDIYIECKSVEFNVVNPTDDIIFDKLQGSIIKAYFKQLLSVSEKINTSNYNWGIIITYKEIFWNDYTELYEIGKNKKSEYYNVKCSHMPPENVFIIDINSWDKIIQLVKSGISLYTILKDAALDNKNSNEFTKKMCFSQHLDKYNIDKYNISYLM